MLPLENEERLLQYLLHTMPSSTINGTRGNGQAYSNQNCFRGKIAQIKISNTSENPSRFFYTCMTNACRFFHWCKPVYTRQMQSMDNKVTTQDVWTLNMNREIQNLKTEVKHIKQLIMAVVLAMAIFFIFVML